MSEIYRRSALAHLRNAAPPPRKIRNYDDLLRLMQDDGLPHQAERDTMTVRVPTEENGVSGMMLIRWLEHEGIIELIQSLPFSVPWKHRGAYSEAIAALNHALVLQGFGLHPSKGSAYYRRSVTVMPRGWVFDDDVRWWFGVSVQVATSCARALARVAQGELDPEDLLDDDTLDITQIFTPRA